MQRQRRARSLTCLLPAATPRKVGVGFDLARGKSTGRLIYNKTFAQQASRVYVDPFGNNSRYVYPDQMTVQRATQQTVEHHIFRSLDKFASHKTQEAHAEAHGWGFKASSDYKAAQDKMSDNLHIVTESTCRLDLYKVSERRRSTPVCAWHNHVWRPASPPALVLSFFFGCGATQLHCHVDHAPPASRCAYAGRAL